MVAFLLAFFLVCAGTCEALIVNDLSYAGTFSPGESKEVTISLTNDKEIPELVEFKLSDYSTNSDGETHFLPPGQEKRSNASWVSLSENRLRLAPKEKADFIFTVKVPNDPALAGSFFSVLLIEPTEFLQSIEEVKSGIQLNVKVRFAYHIVTNVGEGVAKLKIVDKKLVTLADKKYYAVDVANQGTHFLNPKLTLKLYSKQGKLEKTIDVGSERLYPGSSQRYFIDADGLIGNKYKAILVLDNGDKHLFGDTFDLEL